MGMPLEIVVGLRYLRAKRRQTIISVMGVFSVLGVMLGVMTLIIVLGVMNGFEKDLTEKILGTVSHLVVLSQSNRAISGWQPLAKRIEHFHGVKATTPYIYGQAMLSSHGRVRGVVVRGIDPETSEKVICLQKYLGDTIVEDALMEIDGVPGVIVGKELAMASSIKNGDTVQLISPQGKRTPVGAVPRVQNFRVKGIFKSGMYEFDANLVYMSLSQAQRFFEMGDGVTGIEVALADIYRAPKIAVRIEKSLGVPYWTRTWQEMYRNLFSAMKLERIAMFVILTFIVLVAAFNIIVALIMLVIEKRRDIGVLKALGATSDKIMRIFVVQGLFIGVVGTLLGVAAGLGGAALLARYPIIELPEEVYTIGTLPVAVGFADVLVTASVALLICFLATIYPSLTAARLDPVVGLRYE
jgi:lipoprotein-releasing system permease protein